MDDKERYWLYRNAIDDRVDAELGRDPSLEPGDFDHTWNGKPFICNIQEALPPEVIDTQPSYERFHQDWVFERKVEPLKWQWPKKWPPRWVRKVNDVKVKEVLEALRAAGLLRGLEAWQENDLSQRLGTIKQHNGRKYHAIVKYYVIEKRYLDESDE